MKALVRVNVFFFFIGIAGVVASGCSKPEASRDPSSELEARFAAAHAKEDASADERECYKGEERNSEGHCVRIQDIARPGRKGGK